MIQKIIPSQYALFQLWNSTKYIYFCHDRMFWTPEGRDLTFSHHDKKRKSFTSFYVVLIAIGPLDKRKKPVAVIACQHGRPHSTAQKH